MQEEIYAIFTVQTGALNLLYLGVAEGQSGDRRDPRDALVVRGAPIWQTLLTLLLYVGAPSSLLGLSTRPALGTQDDNYSEMHWCGCVYMEKVVSV